RLRAAPRRDPRGASRAVHGRAPLPEGSRDRPPSAPGCPRHERHAPREILFLRRALGPVRSSPGSARFRVVFHENYLTRQFLTSSVMYFGVGFGRCVRRGSFACSCSSRANGVSRRRFAPRSSRSLPAPCIEISTLSSPVACP